MGGGGGGGGGEEEEGGELAMGGKFNIGNTLRIPPDINQLMVDISRFSSSPSFSTSQVLLFFSPSSSSLLFYFVCLMIASLLVRQPDLFVLSIYMPELNGFSFSINLFVMHIWCRICSGL